MAIDFAQLKNELLTDPLNRGYAALVANGQDQDLADLLNAKNRSAKVARMEKDEFLFTLAPVVLSLATKSSDVQSKWDRIIRLITAASAISITSQQVQGMFAAAVADGVLTQEQADGIGLKSASRVEELFGWGTTVHHLDIAKALRG